MWTVVAANGNRLATDGTPVPANADVAIYHKATNVALASLLSASVATSFGPELAVFCQTIKKTGRGAGPAALPGNRWVFVTSSDPSAAVDRRGLRELSPEVLLAQVKQAINSRGAYAFRGLSKAFRTMDDRGDGRLDREDFKFGLRDYGVMLTDEEFEMVMEAFDRDGNGLIRCAGPRRAAPRSTCTPVPHTSAGVLFDAHAPHRRPWSHRFAVCVCLCVCLPPPTLVSPSSWQR